jgi:antitoxin PrlF
MPTQAKSKIKPTATEPVEYAGKRTRTGNSTGFRFEGALFKSHPEFSGDVRARVIAPGRLLVTAEPIKEKGEKGTDPVIASFLAFLAQDLVNNPHSIRPFDETLSNDIAALVDGVSVNQDEDLGPDTLI